MINNSLLLEHQRTDSKIILKWNNVGDLLSKQAEKNPQKLFLILPDEKDNKFTYIKFKKIVNNTASGAVKSVITALPSVVSASVAGEGVPAAKNST